MVAENAAQAVITSIGSFSVCSTSAIVSLEAEVDKHKWEFILQIEEELLMGGVILSEWSVFLAKDAEIAYCAGANIAAILAAQATIESHLRYEYFDPEQTKRWGFYQLIEEAPLDESLCDALHRIRKFRNMWVHVKNPRDDTVLLKKPADYEAELETLAKLAIESMLRVIYLEQCV